MIGKMSSQFKSNHQHALRVTVDHKLRDVCTQEYLSSRAWHMRDRDASVSYSPIDINIPNHPFSTTTTPTTTTSNNDLIKKRKSTSFIRSSASSFSIIIPKRQQQQSELKNKHPSEYELNSNVSSISSVDPTATTTSRRPSQSSQLFRKMSTSNHILSESPVSFDYSSTSSFHNESKRAMERSPSKRQIFVGKILRRISSFHQKSPSSSSPSIHFQEVKYNIFFSSFFFLIYLYMFVLG
jgi:hypothetical protein